MTFLRFARDNAPWLGAGALLAGASGFGQTFFIALYAGVWRQEFGLSHGDWGAIYMVATLTSAAVLTQAGRLADLWRIRSVAFFVLVAFALVCVGVSQLSAWWMLPPLIFGLRFCGQGMLTHLSVVAMGKWFRANRARAMAVAGLGFSIGEAVLPAAALALIAAIGWRGSWLIAAGALVFVVLPVLALLLRRERSPQQVAEQVVSPGMEGRHWTRGEMVRHWMFWAILPAIVGTSWIGTVVFFQIIHLTNVKSWDVIAYAALAYPAYSAATMGASFAIGWAADRFGAVGLLPVYLLGWAVGVALLGGVGPLWAGALALAVAGVGSGGVSIVHGALFAELYGTRWLGGIKAIAAAMMVVGSALGPGASGALLDLGVGFETQCFGMAAYLVTVSLWFVFVSRKARALGASVAEN